MDPLMKLVIIGHRGVGKSTLAKRLNNYFQKQGRMVLVKDLDDEISCRQKKTIAELFSESGEAHFRNLEQSCFQALDSEFSESTTKNLVIVVGAGFAPQDKLGFHFLWVQRPTDKIGRIFVDRPRLDLSQTALAEYQSRFLVREKNFTKLNDEILILSEGFDFENLAEESFFTSQISNLGGVLTVFKHHIRTLRKQLNWGVDFFELRDDLLARSEMIAALEIIPHQNIILSFRNLANLESSRELALKYSLKIDWPIDYPKCEWNQAFLISLHRTQIKSAILSMSEAAEIYPDSQLKLAVKIDCFDDLFLGHQWQLENPQKRSFFPISENGRWKWYRLWSQRSQTLQFFRTDVGSAPDQPSLLERIRQHDFIESRCFAAVLGDPILHSRSPAEHYEFFKERHMPFYAIQVNEAEFDSALECLIKLGLMAAAITSPLKEHASKWQGAPFDAINSLCSNSKSQWMATNTDVEGARSILKDLSNLEMNSIVIWGGGGTLKALKHSLPNAICFSSRNGVIRETERPLDYAPKVLVWAVGRKSFDENGRFPDPTWPIEKIIDLNYAEDSPGRDCALKYGCSYTSGLGVFRMQAEAQRQFWSDHL